VDRVEFYSSPGVPIVADLYLPDGPAPDGGWPGVVACLGWGSVKELMQQWGEALAGRGYAVLVPDYRGFGASGGTRGQCFPDEHVEDVRAAMTYADTRSDVDSGRLSLLGVSYGGAVAVATAGVDRRVQAVISVVGYGSGARHLRAIRSSEQWEGFVERLRRDRESRVLTGVSEEIDPDEILLRDEEARAWRAEMETAYPHMAFRTTLESAEKIIEFEPERRLPYRDGTALLLIHAGDDAMVPVAESEGMHALASEPKKLVIIPGIEHHDVHRGDAFDRVIDLSDDWLRAHAAADDD
jgi:pimeloyl-ACP methyl ester carboxylesterase